MHLPIMYVICYDGNRITGVLEDVDAVTQPGSMDYPGKQKPNHTPVEIMTATADIGNGPVDLTGIIFVRVEMNKSLETQINKVVEQAKFNYYNRRK